MIVVIKLYNCGICEIFRKGRVQLFNIGSMIAHVIYRSTELTHFWGASIEFTVNKCGAKLVAQAHSFLGVCFRP